MVDHGDAGEGNPSQSFLNRGVGSIHMIITPQMDKYMSVLGRFAGGLYTPEAHNEMVEALRVHLAGDRQWDGLDLDHEVAMFANRPFGETRVIMERAKALRKPAAP